VQVCNSTAWTTIASWTINALPNSVITAPNAQISFAAEQALCFHPLHQQEAAVPLQRVNGLKTEVIYLVKQR